MSASLHSLETKIDAVLALCRQLRTENCALKTERDQLRALNQSLSHTIDSTRSRLEALLPRLPEDS